MNTTTLALLALSAAAILSAIGASLSRDNLYSALYMSITLILIAAIYTLFNVQSVFVLIVFIFVGAIGAVTVALAATLRTEVLKIPVDRLWIAPIIVVFAIIAFVLFTYSGYRLSIRCGPELVIPAFLSNYFLLAVFLISLSLVIMVSAVMYVRREG